MSVGHGLGSPGHAGHTCGCRLYEVEKTLPARVPSCGERAPRIVLAGPCSRGQHSSAGWGVAPAQASDDPGSATPRFTIFPLLFAINP